MKSSRLLLILANFLPLTMADTCLGEYQLAGIIFGAIFGTLLITIGFAFILWFLMHKHEQGKVEKLTIGVSQFFKKLKLFDCFRKLEFF